MNSSRNWPGGQEHNWPATRPMPRSRGLLGLKHWDANTII